MKVQKILSRKNYKALLQIFFVASLFLYLYSPFLDHLLGNTHYGRPHTHIALPSELSAESVNGDALTTDHNTDHENHEEGVLCLLDIDALSIILDFDVQSDLLLNFAPDASLIFNYQTADLTADPVFISSHYPPPRI